MPSDLFDVHSHVVPSGDDGVATVEEALDLIREAARRGTRTLYATPHVWPLEGLSDERESEVRATHARMAPAAAALGVELRLGFELTPAPALLEQDGERYRLEGLPAVLMEVPFHGELPLTERVGEHLESFGLTPVIAHPERAEAILAEPELAGALRERGWLLQINASSLLGRHGPRQESLGWELVDAGLADLVASDGHRTTRPPYLDEAWAAVAARYGRETATCLFGGTALRSLVTSDRVDLAQRR